MNSLELDFKACCRLCLCSTDKLLSIYNENFTEKINSYLPYLQVNISVEIFFVYGRKKKIPDINFYFCLLQITETEDDSLPKNICCSCSDTIRSFDNLYVTAAKSNEKLQKILSEKNRREEIGENETDLDLAEALMLDGNNLRLNFAATQDDNDGSDKSLSIETDLAKDIDR